MEHCSMTYQERLKQHLAEYKRTALGIPEPGIFRYRGRDVSVEHILPIEHAWRNLLPDYEEPIRAHLDAKKVKRHQYFHHLNSSQAFAFNLFYPFFAGGEAAAAPLLRAFGQTGRLKDWKLEYIPDKPDKKEGTNIDVWWKTNDGVETFCEVKLSEADFGKAKNDARHIEKLLTKYGPKLAGYVDPSLLEPAAFFKSYQILRNVWHMKSEPGSRLVFLLPKANEGLWPILDAVVGKISRPLQDRISKVAVEDVFSAVLADTECPVALRDYAAKCQCKYVLPGQ